MSSSKMFVGNKFLFCTVASMLATSLTAFVTGCGDDDGGGVGSGVLQVTTWGEDYIESGIPSDDFEDGYSVTYEKFLIVLGNIEIGSLVVEIHHCYRSEFPGSLVLKTNTLQIDIVAVVISQFNG